MKALKIVGIVLGVLVGLVLILGAIAPKGMQTARSITIDAPVELVFATVNDLSTWEKWSPWKEMDPESVITLGEKTAGAGASYSWKGELSGSGTMHIIESNAPSSLVNKVEFDGMGEATARWTFDSQDKGTYVTWGFDSKMPFPMNAILLFSDMSAAIGKDYEKGLANLKAMIEAEEKNKAPKQAIMETDMPYPYVVGVRKKVKMSEIQSFYAENLGKVYAALLAKNIPMAGQPCGVYYTWDEATQTSDMLAAIPVSQKVDLGAGFETIALPEGKAAVLSFYGSYGQLEKAHNILDNYVMVKKLEIQMPVIEEYVTDPTTEPDSSRWLTKVIYPIK